MCDHQGRLNHHLLAYTCNQVDTWYEDQQTNPQTIYSSLEEQELNKRWILFGINSKSSCDHQKELNNKSDREIIIFFNVCGSNNRHRRCFATLFPSSNVRSRRSEFAPPSICLLCRDWMVDIQQGYSTALINIKTLNSQPIYHNPQDEMGQYWSHCHKLLKSNYRSSTMKIISLLLHQRPLFFFMIG